MNTVGLTSQPQLTIVRKIACSKMDKLTTCHLYISTSTYVYTCMMDMYYTSASKIVYMHTVNLEQRNKKFLFSVCIRTN